MNKLQQIKYLFYTTEEGDIDIYHYGRYRLGLTSEEIKDYLRTRANKLAIEKLYKKFNDIAGCNTMALHICPDCGKEKTLMYRHDVQRFADVLFGKTKSTYFD